MKIKNRVAAIAAGMVLSSTQAFGLAGLVDVDAGGGLWMSSMTTGKISGTQSGVTTEINTSLTNESSLYGYIRIDHFIPIVPNIRIEQLNFKTTGTATGTFTILGQNLSFTGAAEQTTIVLNQTDYTAYWGIPFLQPLTLGVLDIEWGLNVKMISGSAAIGSLLSTTAFTAPIPMGHIGAVVDIGAFPFVGGLVDLKITGLYRTIGLMTDMDVKVSYSLPIPIPVVSFGLEAGYRQQTLSTASATDLMNTLGITGIPSVNFDYSGVYFGANLSF